MWAWLNDADVKRNPEIHRVLSAEGAFEAKHRVARGLLVELGVAELARVVLGPHPRARILTPVALYGHCSEADSPAEPEGEEMQRRENIKKRVMIEIKLQDEGQQTEGHKEPSEMGEQYQ
ncbi:hypothetical protein HF521_016849 [Silurus meridionalis]|uniref:Uncharacterized protein n=1 Tax=Silurus meridionalis TaxID=175797 RepID=A0A8T0BSE2_SILME|nr:hypothetical protein HF521_016849 [Silurus meridionalis]